MKYRAVGSVAKVLACRAADKEGVAEGPLKRVVWGPANAALSRMAKGRKSDSEVMGEIVTSKIAGDIFAGCS